jgi:hypothetical protein
MTDTLKSVVEEELQKAYERGVQDGMKREHAMWVLAKIGQEIEAQPVAWMWDINNGAGYSSRGIGFEQTNIPFAKHTPLYTAPPQPEKTDMQIGLTYEEANPPEPALKEKNTC